MAESNNTPRNKRGGRALWLLRAKLALVFMAVVAVAVVVGIVLRATKDDGVAIVKSDKIDITPMQLRSIERIGEWEFLSIADEELVDTVRKGIFTDDQLANIYYGIMRIGIDLGKTQEGWLQTRGDSVVAVLPPVQLLDDNFIDETRTRPFIQSGDWQPADHAALYAKARRLMVERCLTPSVWRSAENNAERQMTNLLRAMGFSHIRVVASHDNGKH